MTGIMHNPDPSTPISIARSAGIVGLATSASRVLGCLRDILIAALLGSGLVADAFIVAFRVPNLIRRLFGEGILAAVVVPVFARCLALKGPQKAAELGHTLLKTGGLVMAGVVAAALICTPGLIIMLAPGFKAAAPKFELTLKLARIMLPYMFFIGMGAIAMGILNSYGHFTAPALAPLVLNVVMISALVATALISTSATSRAAGLAWGVLVGGGLQFLLQIPALTRCGIGPYPGLLRRAPFYPDELKQIVKRLARTLAGAGCYQFNLLVSTLLASFLPEGSITALYFADRLVQLPLGIFVVALSTACLPAFARHAAGRETARLAADTARALQMTLFLTLPAMVGLAILREPVVRLIFHHGAFDLEAARLTADALLYYVLGLSTLAVVRMGITTFFALQEMRVPLQGAGISVAANCTLGILLAYTMGYRGLALAASLATLANCLWLLKGLGRRLPGVFTARFFRSVAKTGAAAGCMGLGVLPLRYWFFQNLDLSTLELAGGTLLCILWGVGCYGLLAMLLKCPELVQIRSLAGMDIPSKDNSRQE